MGVTSCGSELLRGLKRCLQTQKAPRPHASRPRQLEGLRAPRFRPSTAGRLRGAVFPALHTRKAPGPPRASRLPQSCGPGFRDSCPSQPEGLEALRFPPSTARRPPGLVGRRPSRVGPPLAAGGLRAGRGRRQVQEVGRGSAPLFSFRAA